MDSFFCPYNKLLNKIIDLLPDMFSAITEILLMALFRILKIQYLIKEIFKRKLISAFILYTNENKL